MITVGSAGISDSTGGPTEADAVAKYTRSDGGVLANDTYEFSDITYTFTIMVSDGISANNQYISATVDIDVNEPTQLVGDSEIAITREVTAGDVPQELINLQDLVNDDDVDDVNEFTVLNSPAHIVHDKNADGDDVLRLTYIPDGAKTEARVNTITVDVSDGFNDDPDQTLVITVFGKRAGATFDQGSLRGHNGCGKLDRLFAGRRSQRLLGGGRSVRRPFLQY